MIPEEHPRYDSLKIREKLAEGYRDGFTVLEGLIAHGRGEAFNYLLGETTVPPAKEAIRAGAALLFLAKAPIISVNGNTAALCPEAMVELSKALKAKLEVNLFYRNEDRVERIKRKLLECGADEVLTEYSADIPGLDSERRKVSRVGIYSGDAVLVAIEDGDRTEALAKQGKKVVAIDLNPLSRTARKATVTIVDDVIRVLPALTEEVKHFSNRNEAVKVLRSYDRDRNLQEVLNYIIKFLTDTLSR